MRLAVECDEMNEWTNEWFVFLYQKIKLCGGTNQFVCFGNLTNVCRWWCYIFPLCSMLVKYIFAISKQNLGQHLKMSSGKQMLWNMCIKSKNKRKIRPNQKQNPSSYEQMKNSVNTYKRDYPVSNIVKHYHFYHFICIKIRSIHYILYIGIYRLCSIWINFRVADNTTMCEFMCVFILWTCVK